MSVSVDTSWSVHMPDGTPRRGALVSPPQIFGLVTELDLASKPLLDVTVRPYAQDTHPTRGRRSSPACSRAADGRARRRLPTLELEVRADTPISRRATVAQDGVVLGITAVWWLLAPLQVDDGWFEGDR